jgi:hypothetical protein
MAFNRLESLTLEFGLKCSWFPFLMFLHARSSSMPVVINAPFSQLPLTAVAVVHGFLYHRSNHSWTMHHPTHNMHPYARICLPISEHAILSRFSAARQHASKGQTNKPSANSDCHLKFIDVIFEEELASFESP